MQKKLKVVIVGAGGWGLQHARIYASRPDVDLVGIFSRSPERAAARALEFHTRPYNNLALMLGTEKPDLVSVCLPNEAHYAPTLEVIRAGYPLLVEKPLVFDLKEADTLLAEAAQRNLFFAINFNHRYAKTIRLAREAIGNGRVGEITFAWWRFGGNGSPGTPFANLIETQCQAGYFNDFDREFHRTFDLHLDAVLHALRKGEPPPVHARAGKRALVLAHAAIESFQSGQRVKCGM
jgi:predicted dehydrogenase